MLVLQVSDKILTGSQYCDVLCDYPQSIPSSCGSGPHMACSVCVAQVEIADVITFHQLRWRNKDVQDQGKWGEGRTAAAVAAPLSPGKDDMRCGAQYKE